MVAHLRKSNTGERQRSGPALPNAGGCESRGEACSPQQIDDSSLGGILVPCCSDLSWLVVKGLMLFSQMPSHELVCEHL